MQTGFAVFCAGYGKILCSHGSDKVPREHYFGFHTGYLIISLMYIVKHSNAARNTELYVQ